MTRETDAERGQVKEWDEKRDRQRDRKRGKRGRELEGECLKIIG